ncbi:MAG: hypothetical protein FWD61_12115 [Phycisphaerales bacterium]|nr:hypothetical protein [Phycisphaerales bacterium]
MLPIRFIPHAVQVAAGSVNAWINQIASTGPNGGVSLFEETAGSETDREFAAAQNIQPTVSINTSDLTFLATCGFSGIPITPPGITVYGRELPLGGLPTALATGNHLKLSIAGGIMAPVSIRASHNSVATLDLMIHAIQSNQTPPTPPFVWEAGQSIPSGAQQIASIFTTGPVSYTISGGSSRLLQGISDLSVDFGIQVLVEGDSGNVYPSHASIIRRMTKFEFTTKDVEAVSEIGDGVAVSAFGMYFRRVAPNGQRVSEGTTTHIGVSATSGMITPGATTLQHAQSGSSSFTFTPVKDTNLITISTTAAIPTS